MKKFISILFAVSILLSCTCLAFAKPSLVVDNSGVLTQDEIQSLTDSAQKITDTYGVDIVIYYTPSFNGLDAGEFTDRVWQSGYDKNCIILCVATTDREYYYYACGEGSSVMTDYGTYYIDEKVYPELSNLSYYKAADRFLAYTSEFLNHYKTTGHAYDVNDKPSDFKMTLIKIFGCTGLGLLLAGLPLINQKKKLNTVQHKTDADEYVRGSSYNMLINSDYFVTKHVTAIPIPRNDNHGGHGGGGGTSFHMSSSGHSYSGHGGHF